MTSQGICIESLQISNVSCFENLELAFNPSFNLICGTNGVGKTSILNIIGAGSRGSSRDKTLKKNARSAGPGSWKISIRTPEATDLRSGSVGSFLPDESTFNLASNGYENDVLYLTTARDFSYTPLNSIPRDPKKENSDLQTEALQGISYTDIKQWFTNRYLFAPHGETWPKHRHENFAFAKECFSILDPTVSFSHVDTSTYDIYASTSSGKIPYEYLSSGFRASLSILLGILKEIEFRRHERSAGNFSGVIMIDEIDLHLHPLWQQKISGVLRKAFPSAQFIVTTHSPHVIQTAALQEVIALISDENGNPSVADLPSSPYGFAGWTIEEILGDVMGLRNVTSDVRQNAIWNFDHALDAEDREQTIHWLKN